MTLRLLHLRPHLLNGSAPLCNTIARIRLFLSESPSSHWTLYITCNYNGCLLCSSNSSPMYVASEFVKGIFNCSQRLLTSPISFYTPVPAPGYQFLHQPIHFVSSAEKKGWVSNPSMLQEAFLFAAACIFRIFSRCKSSMLPRRIMSSIMLSRRCAAVACCSSFN